MKKKKPGAQKETQNVSFGQEKNTKKFNVAAKAYVEREAVIVSEIGVVKETPLAM